LGYIVTNEDGLAAVLLRLMEFIFVSRKDKIEPIEDEVFGEAHGT